MSDSAETRGEDGSACQRGGSRRRDGVVAEAKDAGRNARRWGGGRTPIRGAKRGHTRSPKRNDLGTLVRGMRDVPKNDA